MEIMKPFVQTLVSCLALVLCLILYARTHFYRDPGSAFFDPSRAYERGYSARREAEVERYIFEARKSGKSTEADSVHNGNGSLATLCVALSSVQREHSEYLGTTVGSMLQGLREEERESLHIAVLIAEPLPEVHSAWSSEWLRQGVDEMFTYDVGSEELERLAALKAAGNYAEKGVYDYTYVLQRCYDTGAPYVGVFEDDVLLADGWLMRTLTAVEELSRSEVGGKRWLFMRLFNQERSTGWASRNIGGNNELWIVLAIDLVIWLFALVVFRQWRPSRNYLDMGTLAILTFFLVPALVILFFQCGKASLLPPYPGVAEEPFGCCSQAMVYPRSIIPSLIDFLRQKKTGQVDLLLKEFAVKMGLARYALYPVQAQHIGLESARNTTVDEAQAVWSMAYEDLDQAGLARYHQQMFEQYYGRRVGDPLLDSVNQ